MAIVITNGEHYIHINEHGKYVKFNNLLNATQFASVHEAISRIKKAPAKTKGYYVYDTFTDKIVWKQFTQEERIEMQENKNVELEIKRTNNGKIKRKKYSQWVRKVIYDKYDGADNLKSIQVIGKADLVEPFSDTYNKHAKIKKLPVETLKKLASPMNLICVTPVKMEVLFSEFKKNGYSSRQTIKF